MEKLEQKILLSITGEEEDHYKGKIEEIKSRNISRVALFLERFLPKQREDIYNELERSTIKEIPLAHIRSDMHKEELELLYKKYNTRYFTIHEDHFDILEKWKGFERNLFLEMNTDNVVSENVKVNEIGGFCIDLAHFQKAKDKGVIDYDYVCQKRGNKELFKCNHLGGYSFEKIQDLHYVTEKDDFLYLKKLPKFIFGEIIAIEINNTIEEQIHFREHIIKMLS